MKRIHKRGQATFIIILAMIFMTMTIASAGAEEMIFKAKGNKKIKIGVIDLISSIEVAGLFNKAHEASAKKRGWDIQIFDLKDNVPESATIMENMISAGYDGIIIHWTDLKACANQIKKAADKGIAVISCACRGGKKYPGVIADFAEYDAVKGALSAEYLANKLDPGDKVVMLYVPYLQINTLNAGAAKAIFDLYKIKVAQEIYYPMSGDPIQFSYDNARNVLTADTKKEIKGFWDTSESFGISIARAAHDLKRDDLIVVTMDDSPNTYTEFRKLPALRASAGSGGQVKDIDRGVFALLDQVFKGGPIEMQQFRGNLPNLITKENLPPKGYFYHPGGYEGRPPDFEVK
jgi:ABC-type sugar transport system substrate-binding protein